MLRGGRGRDVPHLVVSDGLGEASAVELQVDVGELVEQLLGLEAVLLGVLHLQVAALGPAELLQVEVEHGGETGAQLLGGGGGRTRPLDEPR